MTDAARTDAARTSPDCVVVVMAKAPVPGTVKTRLIPALGAERAASLASWLLDRMMTRATESGLGAVELCGAPDGSHPAFAAWTARPGVDFHAQGEGDLGERMAHVFDRWDGSASSVLLVGTDAPHLDERVLVEAAGALHDHDAVLAPAYDGGYALIGLRRPAPELFEGVAWSTPEVMPTTRERLVSSGLAHVELATLHDIDVPADLVHLEGLGWS